MSEMKNKIIILGGGMVGSAIARDLQEAGHLVTVADRDDGIQERLAPFGINYLKLKVWDLKQFIVYIII